jgi:Toastrack DUF4097
MAGAATPTATAPSESLPAGALPTNRWRGPAVVAAATLAGLALLGAVAFGLVELARQKTTQTAEVRAPVRQIVIHVRHGNVHLVAGAEHVSIRSTLHYVFSKPHVSRITSHGVLTLRANCDHSWLVDCSTDLRVAAPRGVAIDAETQHGDISAADLAAGPLRVETLHGDIHLHLANDPLVILANSDDGDVSIDVPPARYAVDAEANLGDTSVSGITRDDRAGRRIVATANNGDVNVSANT